MRVNIFFSFHLCSGKLISIYYVNILILVYIFSFLFKILFNFSIYNFLFGHSCASRQPRRNSHPYFAISPAKPAAIVTWWVPVLLIPMAKCHACFVNGIGEIPLTKCHVVVVKCHVVVPITWCVSLTVITESFQKQTPLIITFKINPISKKVCKSDRVSICHVNKSIMHIYLESNISVYTNLRRVNFYKVLTYVYICIFPFVTWLHSLLL